MRTKKWCGAQLPPGFANAVRQRTPNAGGKFLLSESYCVKGPIDVSVELCFTMQQPKQTYANYCPFVA